MLQPRVKRGFFFFFFFFLHFYGPDLQNAASASWRSSGLIGTWLRSDAQDRQVQQFLRLLPHVNARRLMSINVSMRLIYQGFISLVVTVKPSHLRSLVPQSSCNLQINFQRGVLKMDGFMLVPLTYTAR